MVGPCHAHEARTARRCRPHCEPGRAVLGAARHQRRAGPPGHRRIRRRHWSWEADMAGKHLISARVCVVWALLPAAIVAASGLAHGQESTRPGCVTRYDNGKPYVFCEGEDEYKRMQAPLERNEAVVP